MYYRQVSRLCIFLGMVYAAFLQISKRVLYLVKLTKGTVVVSSRFWRELLTVLGMSELEQGDRRCSIGHWGLDKDNKVVQE